MTPIACAKKWAAEHPDFTGKLIIRTLAFRGFSAHRRTGPRRNSYWVKAGKAASDRDGKGKTTFNGMCSLCGNIYLEPVLRWVAARDPEALAPCQQPNIVRSEGWTYLNAPWAEMSTCPACDSPEFKTLRDNTVWNECQAPRNERTHYVRRMHPSAKFWRPTTTEFDMRDLLPQ